MRTGIDIIFIMEIVKLKFIEKPDLELLLQNILKSSSYKGGMIILYKNDEEVMSIIENLDINQVLRSLNLVTYQKLNEDFIVQPIEG